MFRSLRFMLVASPMLILGQDQTVPLTVGDYITTLLIPVSLAGPSQAPYTVVVLPTAPVVPAAITSIPSNAAVQPATSASFSSYPGLVSPPPGVVSPPPGVVTGPPPGIVASTPPSQASGNAESVLSSLATTVSVSAVPNIPSSAPGVVPIPSSVPLQASINAESVFSSIIAGYTSTDLPAYATSSLLASATSQLATETAVGSSNAASAFTTVTISSISSFPSATTLPTGTGIVVVPLPNGGSTTVSATGSGPSLTSAIAESLLSSTFGLSSTGTAAGAGTIQSQNPNTMYPTADVSGNTMTAMPTAPLGMVTSRTSAANGAQQTIAPPAGNNAGQMTLPLCLTTLFAGFAAVLALH